LAFWAKQHTQEALPLLALEASHHKPAALWRVCRPGRVGARLGPYRQTPVCRNARGGSGAGLQYRLQYRLPGPWAFPRPGRKGVGLAYRLASGRLEASRGLWGSVLGVKGPPPPPGRRPFPRPGRAGGEGRFSPTYRLHGGGPALYPDGPRRPLGCTQGVNPGATGGGRPGGHSPPPAGRLRAPGAPPPPGLRRGIWRPWRFHFPDFAPVS